ncbi:hypothetical protein BsWGS_17273 [Bradybaena similaris]
MTTVTTSHTAVADSESTNDIFKNYFTTTRVKMHGNLERGRRLRRTTVQKGYVCRMCGKINIVYGQVGENKMGYKDNPCVKAHLCSCKYTFMSQYYKHLLPHISFSTTNHSLSEHSHNQSFTIRVSP